MWTIIRDSPYFMNGIPERQKGRRSTLYGHDHVLPQSGQSADERWIFPGTFTATGSFPTKAGCSIRRIYTKESYVVNLQQSTFLLINYHLTRLHQKPTDNSPNCALSNGSYWLSKWPPCGNKMGKKGKKELTQQFCCPAQLCEQANVVYDAGPNFTSAEGKEGNERAKKSLLAKFSPKATPASCSTVSRYMDVGLRLLVG